MNVFSDSCMTKTLLGLVLWGVIFKDVGKPSEQPKIRYNLKGVSARRGHVGRVEGRREEW